MRPYDYIIWDWNGTLLDDLWLALEVANGMLRRRGLSEMDPNGYREIFDFPVETYYRAAGFDFSREPFPVLADEFIGEFNARVTECELHQGAREVLSAVAEAGIPQAILSASRRSSLVSTVEHHGLGGMFRELHGLDDHLAVSKAELGRQVAASLPADRSRVVMVGDTTHDAEVASGMGIPCVLVAGGHQSAARLRATDLPVYDTLSDWWAHRPR